MKDQVIASDDSAYPVDGFRALANGVLLSGEQIQVSIPLKDQLAEGWFYPEAPGLLRLKMRNEIKWRQAPFKGRVTQVAANRLLLRHHDGAEFLLQFDGKAKRPGFRLHFLERGRSTYWSSFTSTMSLIAWLRLYNSKESS